MGILQISAAVQEFNPPLSGNLCLPWLFFGLSIGNSGGEPCSSCFFFRFFSISPHYIVLSFFSIPLLVSFASVLFLISVEQNLLLLFCRKSELYSTKIVRLEKNLIFFSFSFFSSNGNYVSTKNMI